MSTIASNALTNYQNLPLQPPKAVNVPKGQFDNKLYAACQKFEAIFVNQMLTSMRHTIGKSGLFKTGIAHNIYNDMLYQQYADILAKNAHFGLSRLLYNELSGAPPAPQA
jgi:flagellar protein FlgJ